MVSDKHHEQRAASATDPTLLWLHRGCWHVQGGITTADRVVTVSPGYAEEIRTWLGGWGLEGLLNARGPVLNGIVNGIDDE